MERKLFERNFHADRAAQGSFFGAFPGVAVPAAEAFASDGKRVLVLGRIEPVPGEAAGRGTRSRFERGSAAISLAVDRDNDPRQLAVAVPANLAAGKPEAPESGTPEKPAEAAAPKDEAEASSAGVEIKGELKMQELLAQGFQIKTTVLIPAEVVTRQTGKVTADALVVTLQKENAIAVCYYTLKSYVRLRLAGLATCTMFR